MQMPDMIEKQLRLAAYLDRIGFSGVPVPDVETLFALFTSHVGAIPFENVDVQLGHPMSSDVGVVFDKLVSRRRGGWCYEQNGLLAWALAQSGFAVTRFAGGVMRSTAGDSVLGNHLGLIVHLDSDWLVDVGFGGSMAEPIQLIEASYRQLPFDIGLRQIEDGFWRFEENSGSAPFSYDFVAAEAESDLLDAKLSWLATDPDSPFVQNLVVQQRKGDEHWSLRGRVFTILSEGGRQRSLIGSAEELAACVNRHFKLDIPEIVKLWPQICSRHDALFPDGLPD